MAATRRGVRLLLLAVSLWAFVLMPVAAAKARPAHAQVAPYNATLGYLVVGSQPEIAVLMILIAAGYVCYTTDGCHSLVSSVWSGLPSWFGTGILSSLASGSQTVDVTSFTSYDPVTLNAAIAAAEALGFTLVTVTGTASYTALPTDIVATNPQAWKSPPADAAFRALPADTVLATSMVNMAGTGSYASVSAGTLTENMLQVVTPKMTGNPGASVDTPLVKLSGAGGTGEMTLAPFQRTGSPSAFALNANMSPQSISGLGGAAWSYQLQVVKAAGAGSLDDGSWYLPAMYWMACNSSCTSTREPAAGWQTVGLNDWALTYFPSSQQKPDGPSAHAGKVALAGSVAEAVGLNPTANPAATVTTPDGTVVTVLNPPLAAPVDTGILSSAVGILTSIRDYVTDIPNIATGIVALPGAIVDAVTGALVPTASLTTVLATPKATLLNAVPACIVDDSANALSGLLAGATAGTTTIHLTTIAGQSVDLVFQDSTAVQLARLTTKVGALALLVLYGFALFRRFFERSG